MTPIGTTIRQPGSDRVVLRRAQELIAPYRTKLGAWHVEAAALRGLGEFGHGRTGWRKRAKALRAKVLAGSQALDDEAAQIGQPVASHSLIQDVRRACNHLADELTTLIG